MRVISILVGILLVGCGFAEIVIIITFGSITNPNWPDADRRAEVLRRLSVPDVLTAMGVSLLLICVGLCLVFRRPRRFA